MKPDFPEMVQLRAEIAEYDRQIKSQLELVKHSIKAQYEAAREQENSFLRKTASLKGEVLDLRSRSIQYNILQRELDTNRTLYDGLLQQYKEVGVASGVTTNNVQIVDKAEAPGSPSSPRLGLNLMLALVIGAAVAAAAIAVREFLDDTFKIAEDVEEATGLSVLGIIPTIKNSEGPAAIVRQVLDSPHSMIGEAFRSLRTTLQFSTSVGLPKTLLVVSAQPGEGKSFASACLAANLAQLGLRVLLIDADLRMASLHKVLNVNNDVGLSNVLVGRKEPQEAVQEGAIKGVTFMPSGPLPPNPAELIAGPRFASLLATAAEKFDVVVIDGPPVIGLADAPLLGSLVEATLLVVNSEATLRRTVKAAVKRLCFSRTRVLGVILNKFDHARAGRAYGYGYGYGAGEHYGYGSAAGKDLPPALTDG